MAIKPNAEAIVIKLLNCLSINIAPDTVTNELEKHPDYPSLLAVSDVLTALNIENAAFRLSFDELTIIPCPFVAHVYSNGGELLLVKKIKQGFFYVSGDEWNNHKLSAEKFKSIFSGVILTAEESGEYKKTNFFYTFLTKFTTPLIVAGLVLSFAGALVFNTSYFSNLSSQRLLLTLFKTAGLVTSILLLVQSIDSNNPLIQKLCKSNGSKTDCNAILSSKAAKLFNGLTWSEVGFFYFAGTWLLLLFGSGWLLTWRVLFLLNAISLPYTFYSVYYQARIAKQWCILCCTVQAILWLEFVVFITNNNKISLGEILWKQLSNISICLLLPIVSWLVIKPILLKLQQLQPLKHQLRQFKYNAELFNKMLKDQPKFAIPDEEWSIVMGNSEAGKIITMVTNPYCPPCAKMHNALTELLNQNQDIQARIIFAASNTDDDINTQVCRHLIALNDLANKNKIELALHDWYKQKQKNYEAWAKFYPVEIDKTSFNKLNKQKSWCQMAGITATPTMLLNGYRLPDLYQLQDLKYMLQ